MQLQVVNAQQEKVALGRVNLGWTLGEEILFDRTMQVRQEQVVAETESCLIAISKQKLAILQKGLIETDNWKDYYAIESFLKGNFLIKDEWRQNKQIHAIQSVIESSKESKSIDLSREEHKPVEVVEQA